MSNRTDRRFRLKMLLAFAVWKRRDLSPAMRLVFSVLLIGHHNVETGKCNPSYQTLAGECGMARRAVIRIAGKLEEKGLLAIKVSVGRKHTNSFSFPSLEMVTPRSPFKDRKMVTEKPEMVTQLTRNGDPGVTQNIKEHKEHSEASPSPREGAASASLKKENGQQGNRQDREFSPETRAKLERMGVKLTKPSA